MGTKTIQHTPLPWSRTIKANGKYPVIFSGRNNHVCTVSQQATGEETEANIDLIVHAVNSHEMLLKAAENACNVLAELITGDFKKIHADSPALKELREAIAKAKL